MVKTAYEVSNFAGVRYCPLDHTPYTADSNAGQILGIYYPDGTPADYKDVYGPSAGATTRWKVLLVLALSGASPDGTTSNGTQSAAGAPTVDSTNGFPYQALRRGFAVVYAQLTAGQAAVTATGHGFIHLPGGTQGYYESTNRPNALKDTVLVIQHLRFNTANYAITSASSYKLSDWIAIYGINSGFAMPWIGSAPSRQCELGNGGPYEMPTVPNHIVAPAIYPYDWLKFKNDEANTGCFWPAGESGGAGTDDTKAATIAAAPQRYVKNMGAHALVSDFGTQCHPKMSATSNTGPEDLNFGEPFVENVRAFATGVHDSWHMLTLRQALPIGWVRVFLPPATAFTLSSTQATATTIPAAFYDGNLNATATGHVASRVRVNFTGGTSVGELLTAGDGFKTVIFEYESGGGVAAGHISITASATASQNADRLRQAVGSAGLAVISANDTPTATDTLFTSTATDIAANFTWTTTCANATILNGDADALSVGLSGGVQSTASLTQEDPATGYAIQRMVLHSSDEPWDKVIPKPGIRRESQVNTTGRCIVPPRAGNDRAYIKLTNTDPTDTLFYGPSLLACTGRLEPGQSVDIPGSGKLFAKASDSVCTYRAREMPKEALTHG